MTEKQFKRAMSMLAAIFFAVVYGLKSLQYEVMRLRPIGERNEVGEALVLLSAVTFCVAAWISLYFAVRKDKK